MGPTMNVKESMAVTERGKQVKRRGGMRQKLKKTRMSQQRELLHF